MQLSDYMGYFLPKEDSEAMRAADHWRAEYAIHHTRVREFAMKEGATGIHLDNVTGKVNGLVFNIKEPLPAGWKWKNAHKEYAVPMILGAEKIVDMAAARRVKDFLTSLGTYEPQAEVARRVGFLLDYEWQWDSNPPRPYSTLGPEPFFAQVAFVGTDGPICFYAPHARRAHDAFYKENIRNADDPLGPPKVTGFQCVNGADKWEVPEGLEEISESRWALMGAEYKVAKEEKSSSAP